MTDTPKPTKPERIPPTEPMNRAQYEAILSDQKVDAAELQSLLNAYKDAPDDRRNGEPRISDRQVLNAHKLVETLAAKEKLTPQDMQRLGSELGLKRTETLNIDPPIAFAIIRSAVTSGHER